MNTVKKIAMIIVMENDLNAAVTFYKNLGLQLVFHVKDRWAEFKLNNLQIGLCPTQEKVQYNRTGIVFEVEDLAAFYEAHNQKLNFLDKPAEAAHGIMASIQDPSGNILDLYQPTPEKIKELQEKLQGDQCCGSECGPETDELQDADLCCKSEQNSQGCC